MQALSCTDCPKVNDVGRKTTLRLHERSMPPPVCLLSSEIQSLTGVQDRTSDALFTVCRCHFVPRQCHRRRKCVPHIRVSNDGTNR